MSRPVRVRFAPSPTGPLHIGGARTALFNYLFAKRHGGTFLLRIEDTDQSRYVPGAEEYIYESLEWLGIAPSESPKHGGAFRPYRQSERKDTYKKYALDLVEKGHAYYAFDSEQDLEEMRERMKAAKALPQYNAISRMEMRNSLTLPEDEWKGMLEAGEPYVIRLKIPRKEEIRLNDAVRGWVMVHSSTLDDKILLKSDGMPTYHLANVVDDHAMEITHVIRGEEWLPSAPTHVLLYKFLGWEKTMPQFAHLPLILRPDGNGKLSKRDGDKFGLPVFPLEWRDPQDGTTSMGFREEGYLPEAMINFLAFLGWSPGNNEEVFSLEELVDLFDLERVGKSGTKFDPDKLKWYNQHYLRKRPDAEFIIALKKEFSSATMPQEDNKWIKLVTLLKERAIFFTDMVKDASVILLRPKEYDQQVVEKKWNKEVEDCLIAFAQHLAKEEPTSPDEFKDLFAQTCDEQGIKLGKVMQSFRLALTGKGQGPDLMIICELIGWTEVKSRIEKAVSILNP